VAEKGQADRRYVDENPFDFRLEQVRKQNYTIQLTPAERREMNRYQRLYNASKVAHALAPNEETLMGNHLGYNLRYDDITRSVVNKPLEVVPNKYGSHELTTFLQERRARLINQIQEKGTIEDIKDMETYMTKREIEMAFGDLGKYAEDAKTQSNSETHIDSVLAEKFSLINVREKNRLPVLKTQNSKQVSQSS
jgi:hypothetical protein